MAMPSLRCATPLTTPPHYGTAGNDGGHRGWQAGPVPAWCLDASSDG